MNVLFKNKIIGRIENDTYISERTREHIFLKNNGFGISSKVINNLKENGVKKVRIIFENNQFLECPLDLFYEEGLRYVDIKNGEEDIQYILPNKFFNQKIVNEVQTVI